VLILPMVFGAFRPPKPDNRICCDTHLIVTGTSFHALDASKLLVLGPREKPWPASVVEKPPNTMGKISTAEVLRLRATKRCVTR
jgi:hypothetical protein